MSEQLREKCGKLEVAEVEIFSLTVACERQVKQLQEVEALVLKLRGDLDQANLNLRKALRAQDVTKVSKPVSSVGT